MTMFIDMCGIQYDVNLLGHDDRWDNHVISFLSSYLEASAKFI
jgi:hypothetical protein